MRGDVLARVAEALRGLEVRVALAAGATRPAELGPVPESWLVRGTLPQVTLLRRASVAVSHGGNNSVTEALTAGVPLLLPMSTDQFAGVAALEAAGLGTVLDPNALSTAEVRDAVAGLLDDGHERRGALEGLRHDLTRRPGPGRACAAFVG
ncbi:glycosyltransferase [Kocuria sp. CPCC 205263]|uniref:glycosyltransferase n=1 Tax=Kocuria sp. CPCC 205263 TaxID=3073555 RepID=UPI0034D56ED0